MPGYGFLLNNRAAQFTIDPASPNVIAPGKRPFYTIIPGFVTKGGKPFLSFGVMFGDQQAQGQLQVLENILDLGANPQAASDAARFAHSQRNNRLFLESQLFKTIGPALKAMGHDVVEANGRAMGGYQAIMIDPISGIFRGASDHRKDGRGDRLLAASGTVRPTCLLPCLFLYVTRRRLAAVIHVGPLSCGRAYVPPDESRVCARPIPGDGQMIESHLPARPHSRSPAPALLRRPDRAAARKWQALDRKEGQRH